MRTLVAAGAVSGKGGGDGYEVSMAFNEWMRQACGSDSGKCGVDPVR